MRRAAHRRLTAARRALAALGAGCLAACAGQTDHFYALSTLPAGPGTPASDVGTEVVLSVSVPGIDDRREFVVHEGGDRILVLEHERWAAPLSDLATQTLARDIERRRPEVLVAGRGFDRDASKTIRVVVDLVRLSIESGARVTLEAHWRIVDPGAATDLVGADVVESSITAGSGADGYSAIARALSECLASLADRLVARFPAR